jgi:hypothetical protein
VNERNLLSDLPDDPADGEARTDGTPPDGDAAHGRQPFADESRSQLEERIRRLEDSLAQLNASRRDERPPDRNPASPPVATVVPPSPGPITTTPNETPSSFLFNFGRPGFTPPVATVVPPAPPAQEPPYVVGVRWGWFFFDAYAEVRAVLRMFVDPRYPMSWASRLAPLALALLLLTSGYWAPGAGIPYVGTMIDKLWDLPLAFLLFKLLSHEARRYRETSPDFPPALRLPPN